MKVILLEELQGKGGEGDVVEVSRGFANNYLRPNRIAILATKGNLKQLEQRRKNIAKREEVRIANAEELKVKLESATFEVKAKVGDEGILFGSVTSQMIVDAIKEQLDLDIDRRRVDVRKPIKVVGEHVVDASLYRDIKAALKLNVVDHDGVFVAPTEEAAEEAAEEAVEEAIEEAAEVAVVEEAIAEVEEAVAEVSEESADEE